jgi:hypothetical protein
VNVNFLRGSWNWVQSNGSTFSITCDLSKFFLLYVQIYAALLEGKKMCDCHLSVSTQQKALKELHYINYVFTKLHDSRFVWLLCTTASILWTVPFLAPMPILSIFCFLSHCLTSNLYAFIAKFHKYFMWQNSLHQTMLNTMFSFSFYILYHIPFL